MMFNSKKIKDLEKRIGQIEWQLENPPKYKVGDKTKTGIICEVTLITNRGHFYGGYLPYVKSWYYKEVRIGDNKTYLVL
jgi:hypothetical protein